MTRDNVERVARAIYYDTHAGLKNCWDWDDTELDIEHPGARQRYIRYARAAMAATLELAAEDLQRLASETMTMQADVGVAEGLERAADLLLSRANELKGTEGE